MTASPVLWDTPGAALKRNAGVAVTVCLFACLALLPAQVGAAQDPSPSPSPEGLWKAYPLDPTAEPAPKQKSSPAASASANRRPAGAARTAGDGGVSVFVVVLLALVAAGGMLTFVQIHGRRRRETEPAAAPVPLPSRSAAAGQAVPALWHGPSGRFSRAVSETTARATTTATVTATQGPEGKGPREADALPRRDGPAGPAAGEPPPVPPVAAPAPAGSPPDPRLTWAAEIEWRQIDGESRFCVIARGAGTVEIAQSPALDWPPEGPAAVQAVTDAADDLAATLVEAGWKPLPAGSAWYAKRFAWEPAVAEPAKGATGATGPKAVQSTPSGKKPVAPPRPAPRVPKSGEAGTPDRVRSRRSRAKKVGVLGVLAVVGLIAALQFGGSDDPPAGRSAAKAGETIDVSVPLLALVAVLMLVLIIGQIRNVLR